MYSEITTIVDVTEVTSDAELNINPILPGDFNGIGGLHLGDVNVPMVTPSDGGGGGLTPPDDSGDDDTPTTTYVLSMKAGELMVAARSGGVLRRHDLHETDVDEAYAYVRLNAATYVPVVGYLFIFESGDEFHADTADDYPVSETLNDNVSSGGGSGGGGVLEVTVDWDTADGTLDKTWQEIADAPMAIYKDSGYTFFCVSARQIGAQYGVVFASVNTSSMAWDSRHLFVASSASDYPTLFHEDEHTDD